MASYWAKEIAAVIGSGRINELAKLIRQTQMSQMEYTSIKASFLGPINADALAMVSWVLWGELFLKYNLRKTSRMQAYA